jgi:ABC-type phosphate transport system substrate-binding protein
MLSISARAARRIVPACVISAAAVAALTGPSVASAERLPSCKEGTAIDGEGSTLQELAQKETWGGTGAKRYNAATQTNPKACPGGPGITYNDDGKTGSGKGMENWYELQEFGPEDQAFVGTDNPPNEEVKTKIEARGTGGKVLTIPTLQAAIAIIVHLPTGCTAESKGGAGGAVIKRLVFAEKTVESIFRGNVPKWSKLKDGGDKLVGCAKSVTESPITRVVREDGSGTTATFKKSLELINGKGEAELGKVCNDAKTLTWLQCAEEPPKNITWPKEAEHLLRGNGSGGVIEKVEETPGSIGYVNLANARKGKGKGVLPGGEGQNGFWAPIENGSTETVGGVKFKIYADPSDNGDNATASRSNCEETEYVAIVPKTGKAEKGKFPPSSTEKVWNIVSAEKKEKHYSFCGFTYDLALTKYNGFTGATEAEATTAGDYLEFVLNSEAEGGQKLIEENKDYLGLPTNPEPKKNVLKIAQEGAAKVQF